MERVSIEYSGGAMKIYILFSYPVFVICLYIVSNHFGAFYYFFFFFFFFWRGGGVGTHVFGLFLLESRIHARIPTSPENLARGGGGVLYPVSGYIGMPEMH